MTKLTLDVGPGLNSPTELSYTPLHLAAILGQERAATCLLEKGSDPALRDALGNTASDHAKRRGFDSMARLFEFEECSEVYRPLEESSKASPPQLLAMANDSGSNPESPTVLPTGTKPDLVLVKRYKLKASFAGEPPPLRLTDGWLALDKISVTSQTD